MNRFSKDLGAMDERLQAMILENIEFIFIISGVILQIVIINRWSILVVFFMGFLFYKGRRIAIKTTRNLMRLDAQGKIWFSSSFIHSSQSMSFTDLNIVE